MCVAVQRNLLRIILKAFLYDAKIKHAYHIIYINDDKLNDLKELQDTMLENDMYRIDYFTQVKILNNCLHIGLKYPPRYLNIIEVNNIDKHKVDSAIITLSNYLNKYRPKIAEMATLTI
jgi:hypothetical protein